MPNLEHSPLPGMLDLQSDVPDMATAGEEAGTREAANGPNFLSAPIVGLLGHIEAPLATSERLVSTVGPDIDADVGQAAAATLTGTIPKVSSFGSAQRCDHLLNFECTPLGKFPIFKPPTGKLSAVTRKKNELLKLIDNEFASYEIVKSVYSQYIDKCLKLFEEVDHQRTIVDAREIGVLEQWIAPHKEDTHRVQEIVNGHLNKMRGQASLPEVAQADGPPSVRSVAPSVRSVAPSVRSVAPSVRSVASSSSSVARARLAEKKAKLEAEKKYLRDMEIIENEELERKKINEKYALDMKRKKRKAEIDKEEYEQKILQQELDDLDNNLSRQSRDHSQDLSRDEDVYRLHEKPPVKLEAGEIGLMSEVLKQQVIISQNMISCQERVNLPKKIVPVFDGRDITLYPSFIRSFQRQISSRCDAADAFYYLEQYTTGTPQELVRSCSNSDPGKAFQSALKLLNEEFGNEYKIAASYVEMLDQWPQVKSEDGVALQELSMFTLTCMNYMSNMTTFNQLNSPGHIMSVIHKLPFELRKQWRSWTLSLMESGKEVNFKELVGFLRRQARILNQPVFGQIIGDSKRNLPNSSKRVLATRIDNNERENDKEKVRFCLYCKKNNHDMPFCFFFKKLSYNKRIEAVKSLRVCYGCLKEGHIARECKNRLDCKHCSGNHPTVLHRNIEGNEQESLVEEQYGMAEGGNDNENDEQRLISLKTSLPSRNLSTGAGGRVLCPIVPVKIKVRGRKEFISTYAALDTCSSASFMDARLLKKLDIGGRKRMINIDTIRGGDHPSETRIVNHLQLFDIDNNLHDEIPVVFAQQHWPFVENDLPNRAILSQPHLRSVPYHKIDASIGMIIGMDRSEMLKPLQVVDGPKNSPYATLYKLGWAICGNYGQSEGKTNFSYRIDIDMNNLEEELQRLYSSDYTDGPETKLEMSENDKKWRDIMVKSIRLTDDQHYEIALPFNTKNLIEIPNNKDQAYRNFINLRNKMMRNSKFFEDYRLFMQMMLEDGHMETVPADVSVQDTGSWYLSHHGVYHKQKQKIRVVFNCSLSFRGVSLNDILYQGPDLTSSLLGVLLRFRQDGVAFTGDIKKMFYQVRVPEDQRQYLKFFWFRDSDLNGDIVEYRLTVHVFGATSSPSVANFALRHTIQSCGRISEGAKTTVLRNFYVDDLLKSCKDEEEAVAIYNEVKAVVAGGGFELTKFVSNSNEVMREVVGEEFSSNVKNIEICGDITDRVLGMKWDTTADTLGFSINISNKPACRRGILSTVHSVYDPMGLCCPAILPAKKIFQETCRLKLDWNEELPQRLNDRWNDWLKYLPMLNQYSFPRCLNVGDVSEIEIHYFSDGSEIGYGSVAYGRFKSANGAIHCAPIIAKGKLNPLGNNTIKTIPRVELNGAKVSIILKNIIDQEMEYNIDREFFWTDSATVLKYLFNEDMSFMRFVSNRIAFIKSHSCKANWRYVPGSINPADMISRGISIPKFMLSELWRNGPDFLWKDEEHWPEQIVQVKIEENDPELKKPRLLKVKCQYTQTNTIDNSPTRLLLESCSNWYKLRRRIAWMLRIKGYLCKVNISEGNLTLQELKYAEGCIVAYLQKDRFPNLINDVTSSRPPKEKMFRKLNLFLDVEGKLRVGGRIDKSDLPFEEKHPILLPGASKVVHSIVCDVHRSLGHMGRESILSHIQKRYWVVGINSIIKKIMFECLICRRLNANPYQPIMASLPPDRLEGDTPAFTNVGLDYFGPFTVINGRKTEKRYGVIFSCLSSRAIHVEMAYSLNTDSFINAFRRFMARRGNVQVVRSDNGSNLAAGQKELQDCLSRWNQSGIEHWMLRRGIDWKFQPPASSNFGGAFEREIRNVRKVLNSMLMEQPLKLNDEQLNTLFCESEGILNSRPLTEMSRECDDFEAITPNHLLLLSSGVTFPPGLFVKEDNNFRRRWRQVQYLADVFWSRWKRTYIPLLQERQKWNKNSYQYAVGDLVLLTDQNLPRSQWSLGRIIRVFPSDDGVIRVVTVRVSKVKNGEIKSAGTVELKRPVSKLVLMKSLQ